MIENEGGGLLGNFTTRGSYMERDTSQNGEGLGFSKILLFISVGLFAYSPIQLKNILMSLVLDELSF